MSPAAPTFNCERGTAVATHYCSATYAIASGIVLAAVLLLWQPSGPLLYEVQGLAVLAIHAAFATAIAGSMWGYLALGAFDPFGRGAIDAYLHGKPQPTPQFSVRGPYPWVRHPLYFCMLVLIWATPFMSTDRLLFNVLWTIWLVLGSYFEEGDLVAQYGDGYRRYQDAVPMLLPWRGRAKAL